MIELKEPKAKMLRSAAVLAQELGNSGIVVFTRSGFLAYTLAALRAVGVPIYAFTDDEALFRQLLLPVGRRAVPDAVQRRPRGDHRMRWPISSAASGATGTWLVVITNALAHDKVIDTMQLRQVE